MWLNINCQTPTLADCCTHHHGTIPPQTPTTLDLRYPALGVLNALSYCLRHDRSHIQGCVLLEHLTEAESSLAASEDALRDALEAMPGLVHYYVAIDREHGQLTNVSVWDTLEHAQAMSSLARCWRKGR